MITAAPQNNLSGDPNLSDPAISVFGTTAPSEHEQSQNQQQSIFTSSQNSASNFSEQFYESNFNGMENDFDTENENDASDQFMSSDDLKPTSSDAPANQMEQSSQPVKLPPVEVPDDIFQSSSSLHAFPSDNSLLVVQHQQRPSSTGNLPSIKNEAAITVKSFGDTLLHNPSAGVVINTDYVQRS